MSVDLPVSVFDDATDFNKKLAIVSFACAVQTSTSDNIKSFFTGMGFDNIKQNESYDSASANSISYTFAHREVSDYTLIIVAPRSLNYGAEWASIRLEKRATIKVLLSRRLLFTVR